MKIWISKILKKELQTFNVSSAHDTRVVWVNTGVNNPHVPLVCRLITSPYEELLGLNLFYFLHYLSINLGKYFDEKHVASLVASSELHIAFMHIQ